MIGTPYHGTPQAIMTGGCSMARILPTGFSSALALTLNLYLYLCFGH